MFNATLIVYNNLKEKPEGARFSYLELICIWRDEPGTWNGNGFQMMKLSEIMLEITGVRTGDCAGCKRGMLDDVGSFSVDGENHTDESCKELGDSIQGEDKCFVTAGEACHFIERFLGLNLSVLLVESERD